MEDNAFQPGSVISYYNAERAREKNILGSKISLARKENHLTQKELVKKLSSYGVNIQAPALNKWESGETVPNAYQLIALCHALNLERGISYFTGPIPHAADTLNSEGKRLLHEFHSFLMQSERYTFHQSAEHFRYMPVSLLSVSAGFGDFLDEETFEKIRFPAAAVPESADFGVHVNGDSMQPAYQDGQLVWIRRCTQLNNGDIGLFIVNGEGFMKTYEEEFPVSPEEIEDYIDSTGVLHPKIRLLSLNPAYPPKEISPDMEFRIIGKVV